MARLRRPAWHRQWQVKVCQWAGHRLWLKADGSIHCYEHGRAVG